MHILEVTEANKGIGAAWLLNLICTNGCCITVVTVILEYFVHIMTYFGRILPLHF